MDACIAKQLDLRAEGGIPAAPPEGGRVRASIATSQLQGMRGNPTQIWTGIQAWKVGRARFWEPSATVHSVVQPWYSRQADTGILHVIECT